MIRVLHPGIYSSVQDNGRIGLSRYGVPMGGAMDSYSHEIGNILLKNRSTAASLEITFGGAKLKFDKDTYICVTGADFSPKLNEELLEMKTVYPVKAGSVLTFGQRKFGVRTYVAVQGGIVSAEVLGSRSFGAGLTDAFRLAKGDELAFPDKKEYGNRGFSKMKRNDMLFDLETLDCYPGPEFDLLSVQQQQELFASFTLTEDNDRTGYRLLEKVPNEIPEMITSSVLPGTVQLTASGTLLILMRDGQVTGGYPRVLQLDEFALCQLSQKMAGKKIRFALKESHFGANFKL